MEIEEIVMIFYIVFKVLGFFDLQQVFVEVFLSEWGVRRVFFIELEFEIFQYVVFYFYCDVDVFVFYVCFYNDIVVVYVFFVVELWFICRVVIYVVGVIVFFLLFLKELNMYF